MKKLVIVTAATLLASAGAYAALDGSKHDLAGTNSNDDGRICVCCHTPHGVSQKTLWNRSDSSSTGWTMYNSSHSASIDMTVAARPSNNSMQCLSCHDGTQTIDAIANVPNDTTWANATTKVTGVALFGQNLTSEHPISVKYDNTTGANGDTDFKALTTADDTLPFYGTNSDYVECGSCHDPHDTTYEPFLRITNQNSGLCLTCHTK